MPNPNHLPLSALACEHLEDWMKALPLPRPT